MAQVNILRTEILSDKHTKLSEVEFEVVKDDGSRQTQTREVLDHGNAAACLLYNPEAQQVLLTKQLRIVSFLQGNGSGMLLEAAAGILEEGEDPADTMIREIEEETGYKINSVQKVYEAFSSPGAYMEKLFLYVAEYRPNQRVSAGGGLEAEGEDITQVTLSFTEAKQMLERGEIQDAKTIILLQYALLKGLIG